MIKNWLDTFKKHWLQKNIDAVLNLFSDNLLYYETPYQKITDKNTLRNEWECVIGHEIVALDFDLYMQEDNRSVVRFRYEYVSEGKEKKFTGIYLIEVEEGKGTYFYQVGE